MISEIYPAFCGEGIETGLPAVFVRTSGCNLRCPGWPCDTPYTSVAPEGDMIPVEAVVDRVLSFGIPRAFITGGEPLLWRVQVGQIAKSLREADVAVILQSNGTVYAPEVFELCDQVSLDHKTPSSNERSDPGVIAEAVRTHCHVQVKFPVADEADLAFAVARAAELPPPKGRLDLVLQPVNRVGTDDTASLLRKLRWLQEQVMAGGHYRFRVLPQMHVLIHGSRVRGV
jgi:organic radical activating enzyme